MTRNLGILLPAVLLLFASPPGANAQGEQRSFRNENVGQVTLVVPKDWRGTERHHITFGTTFYRLVPPQKSELELELLFNDLEHMRMDALVDRDLEIYITSNMAPVAPQSVEGKVSAIRFGAGRDGVYARLTDKAPRPGEFLFFTQGLRLVGRNVVLFTLYSSDADGNALRQALDIVDSVKFEK